MADDKITKIDYKDFANSARKKFYNGSSPTDVEIRNLSDYELAKAELNTFGDEYKNIEVVFPSKTESFVRGAAQGGSFGFADEAAGLVEALKSDPKRLAAYIAFAPMSPLYTSIMTVLGSKDYVKGRDESREKFAAAKKENPKTYFGGEVAGAVAVPVPGNKVVAGMKGLGKAAALGTTAGALAGAGYSEGETPLDVIKDTGKGAALGAVTSSVIHGGLSGLRQLTARMSGIPKKLIEDVTEGKIDVPKRTNISQKTIDKLNQDNEYLSSLGLNLKPKASGDNRKLFLELQKQFESAVKEYKDYILKNPEVALKELTMADRNVVNATTQHAIWEAYRQILAEGGNKASSIFNLGSVSGLLGTGIVAASGPIQKLTNVNPTLAGVAGILTGVASLGNYVLHSPTFTRLIHKEGDRLPQMLSTLSVAHKNILKSLIDKFDSDPKKAEVQAKVIEKKVPELEQVTKSLVDVNKSKKENSSSLQEDKLEPKIVATAITPKGRYVKVDGPQKENK